MKNAKIVLSWLLALLLVLNPLLGGLSDLSGASADGEDTEFQQNTDAEESSGEESDGEESDGEESDGEESEGEESDGEESEGEESEGEESEGEESEGEETEGEETDGEESEGEESEGEESEGEESEGEESEGEGEVLLRAAALSVAEVNGAGYTDFASALNAWTEGTTLKLLADVTMSSTVTVSGTKTLDLNGHGLRATGTGYSVITVPSGANLTLDDSDPGAVHKFSVASPASNGAGLATVDDANGTQSFTGGYITGGSAPQNGTGAAVTVAANAVFTLRGGTIIGNQDTKNTGGICGFSVKGTMNMSGGRICYNLGVYCTGAIDVYGGTFTMSGGSIDHNVARSGGGIFAANSTVSISGGSIVNNSVKKGGSNNPDGAGICLKSGTLRISGSPEISGNYNITNNASDNIRLRGGQTILIDGALTNATPIGVTMQSPGVFTNSTDTSLNDATKFISDNSGYEVYKNAEGQLGLRVPPVAEVNGAGYTDFASALSAWTDGTTLKLFDDVTTGSTITVSGTKTLDLNGHGVKATGTGYSVITVGSGASLTINDSTPTTTHKFTPPSGTAGRATLNEDSGTLIISGGYITGANGSSGIRIDQGSVMMTGGVVIGNQAASGAGVYLNGNMSISGTAAIRYNTTTGNEPWNYGGGILVDHGTLSMSGGEISNNHSAGDRAGGVEVEYTDALFKLSGGTITGNTIAQNSEGGSGVTVWMGKLELSGNPEVTGNTRQGAPNNIFIANKDNVSVTGSLTGDSESIGVTLRKDTGVTGPGVFTNSTDTSLNDASKFISDNSAYEVYKNADGQLGLRVPPVAEVNGAGYTDFASALSAWTDGTTLKLFDDVTTGSTITVSGTKILDLNGHGIRATGSGYCVLNVTGDLTIDDSDPNAAHKFTVASPAVNGAGLAVVDDANGTQSFTGGYITGGNNQVNGGGVIVSSGTLTMIAGNIIGNYSGHYGGGVAVHGGSFNFTGGSILHNEAGQSSGGVHAQAAFMMSGGTINGNLSHDGGAAVSVYGNGSFTMSAGEISGNCIQEPANQWNEDAGAVSVNGSSTRFVLSGGSIINNICVPYSGNSAVKVGGIFCNSSLSLSGAPVIQDNKVDAADINVYVSGAKINVNGTLSNTTPIGVTLSSGTGVFTNSSDTSFNDASRFTSDNSGYEVYQNADGQLGLRVPPVAEVNGTGYGDLASALNAWTEGTTLKLLKDVETSSTITVSGTKTLDLNGCGIRMTGSGSVFSVTGSLTINDSSPNAAHKFTVASPAANGAGLATVNDADGTMSFTGGYITGGNTHDGGALYINGGSVTLNGGTLIGNKANTNGGNGGAVRLDGGAKYTMDGGAILHNGTNSYGGAISLGSGTFTLKRGTISHNRSTGNGGAIHTNGSSNTVIISGGSIINNHTNGTDSAYKGGGVIRANGTALQISGNPVISGNTSGSSETADNVFLRSGETITVTGALTNTTPIGVTMETPGVFTNSTTTTYNDATKFTSDDASYAVGKNADGQLLLGAPVTASYATDHGTAPDAQTVASGSVVTLPAAPTASGWTFDGWSDGTNTHDAGAEVTVSANTSFTALWTAVAATAPTISAQPQALSLTYGYESGSLSVTAEAAEGHTVSGYQWYANTAESAENATALAGATEASYTLPTGQNAGTTYYYCVVTSTRTDNGETADSLTSLAAVTIERASLTVTADAKSKTYGEADPAFTATVEGLQYEDDESAVSYTLSRAEGENVGSYTITPSGDSVQGNYDVAFETAALTVNKAAPTYTYPAELQATYGDTLGDIAMPTGWSWDAPGGTSVGDAGSYSLPATFTPADTLNYSTVSLQVGLTVNPAEPACEVPTDLTATYGDTLADVVLPEGWSWDDPGDTSVGGAGTHSFSATFTPTDTHNYKTVTSALSLRVEKAVPDEGERPETVEPFEYDGEAHALAAEGSTEDGAYRYRLGEDGAWSETPPEAAKADTYTVYFYLKGDENHLDLGSEAEPFGSFDVAVTPRLSTEVEALSGPSEIAAEGLDALADALQKEAGASDVAIQMTVERRTEAEGGEEAVAIRTQLAENQDMDVFEINIEAMVDSVTTLVTDTGTVLKIVVPYNFTGKENPVLYHCHDGVVTALPESDSGEDGTCRLDTEGGTITIYSSRFSAYAVGYTQLYTFTGSVSYGDYSGPVAVSLAPDGGGEPVAQATVTLSGGLGVYQFTHIPKGSYLLSVEWTENDEPLSLEETIEVS